MIKKHVRVLLLLSTEQNKMMLQWKGPFQVAEVLNKFDYRIKSREKRCVAVIEDVECIPDGTVDETNLLDYPQRHQWSNIPRCPHQ